MTLLCGVSRLGSDVPVRDDDDAVRRAAQEAISDNQVVVADFLGGKQAAIGRLIGETMKRTGGRAKPDAVREILLALLNNQ